MSGALLPGDLGTVLGVWAHPDDEAYLMAGTALLAAAAGSTVACVTATAGEAGESADEERWPHERLERIRRDELAASLAILGISDHTWLDLPDGRLAQSDRSEGVRLLSETIERVRADTILTFGQDGMTGHRDHVAVGDWAVEAAVRARSTACRVLAATKTPAWLDKFSDVNDGILALDPPCTPPDELALHVSLDDELLDRKFRALQAQASQTSALIAALGDATYRSWLSDEFWVIRER
jgi:LmbE family N-acetylglucosaminyl deacetylase